MPKSNQQGQNYYDILDVSEEDWKGVTNTSDGTECDGGKKWKEFQDEIKTQYHTKAKIYHPDKNREKSEEERQALADQFKALSNAYAALSDPVQKESFDRGDTAKSFSEAELNREDPLVKEFFGATEDFSQSARDSMGLEHAEEACKTNDIERIRNCFAHLKHLILTTDRAPSELINILDIQKRLFNRLVTLKMPAILLFQDFIQIFLKEVFDPTVREGIETIFDYANARFTFRLRVRDWSDNWFTSRLVNVLQSVSLSKLLLGKRFTCGRTGYPCIELSFKSIFFTSTEVESSLSEWLKYSHYRYWDACLLLRDIAKSIAENEKLNDSSRDEALKQVQEIYDYLSDRKNSANWEEYIPKQILDTLDEEQKTLLLGSIKNKVKYDNSSWFSFQKDRNRRDSKFFSLPVFFNFRIFTNPFKHIAEAGIKNTYLRYAARILRPPTFKKRFKDTFRIFCKKRLKAFPHLKLTLLDYIIPSEALLAFLVYFVASVLDFYMNDKRIIPRVLNPLLFLFVFIPLFVVWLATWSVKYAIAGVITFLVLPIIYIIHLVLKPKIAELSQQTNTVKIKDLKEDLISSSSNKCMKDIQDEYGEYLLIAPVVIKEVDNQTFYSRPEKVSSLITVFGVYQHDVLRHIIEITPENRDSLNAMISSNTGHIAETLDHYDCFDSALNQINANKN